MRHQFFESRCSFGEHCKHCSQRKRLQVLVLAFCNSPSLGKFLLLGRMEQYYKDETSVGATNELSLYCISKVLTAIIVKGTQGQM